MSHQKDCPKKVLLVGPMPADGQYVGGIAVLLKQIIHSWDLPRKWAFYNTEREPRDYGKTGQLRPHNIFRFVRNLLGLWKTIHHEKPGLVHYHTSRQLALLKDIITVFLLKSTTGCKVIGHIHSACGSSLLVGHWNFGRRLQTRALYKAFDGLILMSRSILYELEQKLPPRERPCFDKKTKVLYNFTLLPQIEVLNREAREEVTLFFIGNVGRAKGIFDLIDAAAILRARGTARFRVIAAGPFHDAASEQGLRQKVADAGMDRLVQFPGSVSGQAKEDLFRNADVFVLPSYSEGVPMSMLEAMAYALPVVSTSVGGIPEVLIHGEAGFLITPGDVESLSTALQKLIASPELRTRMGLNGRRRIEQHHAPQTYVRSLEAIYNEHAPITAAAGEERKCESP